MQSRTRTTNVFMMQDSVVVQYDARCFILWPLNSFVRSVFVGIFVVVVVCTVKEC